MRRRAGAVNLPPLPSPASRPARRIEEGGPVASGVSAFALFDGPATAAGHAFDAGLAADTPIYRISFAGMAMRRRKTVAPQFA